MNNNENNKFIYCGTQNPYKKNKENNKFLYSRTQNPYKKNSENNNMLYSRTQNPYKKTTKTTKSYILEHKNLIKNNENNEILYSGHASPPVVVSYTKLIKIYAKYSSGCLYSPCGPFLFNS